MQHVEHGDFAFLCAIEDQVIPVNALADACGGVARDEGGTVGEVGQPQARGAQLANESQGTWWMVPRNRVADPFEIGFGLVR